MIRMEYDVQTAGVRVSFIVLDGDLALTVAGEGTFVGGVSRDGKWLAPQNLENTKTLIAMLEEMCVQEEKQLDNP